MPKEDTDFNTKVVEAVERHPCLYNYTLKSYSNRDVVNAAWEDIAQEMGVTAKECKKTWRTLRIVYTRNSRERRLNESAKKYYLLDKMEFLRPYVIIKSEKTLVPPSNIKCGENEYIEPQCVLQEEEDEELTLEKEDPLFIKKENITLAPKKIDEPPSKKKKDVIVNNINDVKVIRESVQENHRRQFVFSLLPDIEEMTPSQFRQFRKRTCNLIDEILEPSSSSTSISIPNHAEVD